jgi:hypothetical protein
MARDNTADRDRFFALMHRYNELGNELDRIDNAAAAPVLKQMAMIKAEIDLLMVCVAHKAPA